jgi:hypothetical protein
MRCQSCGTQNEPDSRFCGGCGARLAGESRLAPTQKIDTGAQPVQTPAHVVAHRTPSQEPPASYPLTPSVQRPPTSKPHVSQPAPMHTPAKGSQFGPSNGASPAPATQSVQPTSQQPRPRLDASKHPNVSASASIAVPKRRIGLIIAVLLVDLALAGAGAYMLAEGLASAPATPSASQPAEAPGSGSSLQPAGSGSAAKPAAAATGTGSAASSVVPPDAAAPANAIANAGSSSSSTPPDAAALDEAPADAAVAETPVKTKSTQSRNKKKVRKQTTQPVDPYDEGPADPFPPDIAPTPPPPPPPGQP